MFGFVAGGSYVFFDLLYLQQANIPFYIFVRRNLMWLSIYSYSLVLRHTTEEVLATCIEALEPARVALTSQLRNRVMNDLMDGLKTHSWFKGFDINDKPPVRFPIEQWIELAKEVQATVFIAGFVLQQFIFCLLNFLHAFSSNFKNN